VAVEEGGAEAVEAADMVEEAEAGTPVTGLTRTRTKLRRAIIIGNEVTTGRWRRRVHHLRSITVRRYTVELYRQRDVISVNEPNWCGKAQIVTSKKTSP